MSEYNFRLADRGEKKQVLDFLHRHWDVQDPFVDDPVLFAYYFEGGGALQFALAEKNGEWAALAGYILANREPHPDVWVSYWVADPAARGAGLELMAALPELIHCRTLACNNIRPKTRPFYEFLGFTTGRVGHFYRLAQKENYRLAVISERDIPPVTGDLELQRLWDGKALEQSGFVSGQANPRKDRWYIERRYYAYPRQEYEVYGAFAPGAEKAEALLVARTIPVEDTAVLRIVDFMGPQECLPRLGAAMDNLMQAKRAEYADFYCAGIPSDVMRKAGFAERREGDGRNILPNYLQPPVRENTDYYYFTSDPGGFRLCKADGDQDRPR
ncbi:hypothetical protein LJC49_08310 [Ruminococcaceae bacterium OttesenSCG-928-I18]|nr:hypothetical protein [Ruminococcaceae bacterium OttesenSCG-928-I18]